VAFGIQYTDAAERDMAALPKRLRRELRAEIQALSPNPRAPKKADWLREEWEGWWRLSAGEYRVIYAIDDRLELVTIERVPHRSQVYEGGPGSL
jgi:mRNA interferase RelE/StbE